MGAVLHHDVGGLEIDVQVSGPAAQGQGRAHIQSKIYGLQMGDGCAADGLFQCAAVFADQVYLIAQPVGLHGNDLPVFIAGKAVQLGHAGKECCFGSGIIRLLAEIVQRGGGVAVGTGYKQGIQLNLGRRHGQNFYDIFLIGILLHGRVTADTRTLGHGGPEDKPIEQRRDQCFFGHFYRLLDPHIIK